jgi:hypothetical protein
MRTAGLTDFQHIKLSSTRISARGDSVLVCHFHIACQKAVEARQFATQASTSALSHKVLSSNKLRI